MGPSPSLTTIPLSSSQKSSNDVVDVEQQHILLPSSLPQPTFKPPLTMAQEVITHFTRKKKTCLSFL
jgi:hypothetical protein